VKEHITFLRPLIGRFQVLTFNKDLTRMVERLANSKVTIYQRVGRLFTEVSWMPIQDVLPFPQELSRNTFYPLLFDPSFTRMLDIDRKAKAFIIRPILNNYSLQKSL